MFAFLGEIGSSVPWFYRGALYLISSAYRTQMRDVWRRGAKAYVVFDVVMTTLFLAAEVFVVVAIVLWASGWRA